METIRKKAALVVCSKELSHGYSYIPLGTHLLRENNNEQVVNIVAINCDATVSELDARNMLCKYLSSIRGSIFSKGRMKALHKDKVVARKIPISLKKYFTKRFGKMQHMYFFA